MSAEVTVLLVLVVVLCQGWIEPADATSWRSSNNSVSALSSLDEVRGNGSMLLNITARNVGKNDLLFPSLNFTCNGTIDRLVFLAEPMKPSFNLNFGLWSPTHNNAILYHRKMLLSTSEAVHVEDSRIAYEIKPKEVSFVEGDVFGIHQDAPRVNYELFLERKKVQVCNYTNNMCKAGRIGYPLIAIETGMLISWGKCSVFAAYMVTVPLCLQILLGVQMVLWT